MKPHRLVWIIGLAGILSLPAAAQQGAIRVDGDDVTITGCVSRTDAANFDSGSILAWTKNDLLLSRAVVGGGPTGTAGSAGAAGLLYYLDKNDSLEDHIGEYVEVKGDVGDIEKGRVKVDHDGDYTEVTLRLDGDEEKVRVPSSWFGPDVRDRKYDVIARKIEVDDVRVLGACPAR
jgi:hypothetical protein